MCCSSIHAIIIKRLSNKVRVTPSSQPLLILFHFASKSIVATLIPHLAFLLFQNMVLTTYKRRDAGFKNMNDRISSILAYRDQIMDRVNTDTTAADAAIQRVAANYVTIMDTVINTNNADLSTRITGFTSTIASLQTALLTTLPSSISTTATSLTTQLSTEKSARVAMSAPLAALLGTIDAAVAPSVSTMVTDRSAIRASISSNTIFSTFSSQLSSAVVIENSRGTAKATNQATSFSSVKTTFSTALSTGIASEAVRADTNCSSAAAAVAFTVIDHNGADDYTVW